MKYTVMQTNKRYKKKQYKIITGSLAQLLRTSALTQQSKKYVKKSLVHITKYTNEV